MCSYTSTRGSSRATLAEALSRGLAPDGGLYVPTRVTPLPAPRPVSRDLHTVAEWVAPALFPQVSPSRLSAIASASLPFPVPLVELESDVHVLELFHGPTHAFKDIGARFLARLLGVMVEEEVDGAPGRTVLVATSGDTGGAVADAFLGVEGVNVVVLFPRDGVSARQRKQMTTLGGNVTALAVEGDFDDCQRLAKEAFLDTRLAARHRLTSANSINIGRLLPQALYYVYAAVQTGWAANPARFLVPSGNLGNLCAGLIAKRMGMPTAGFVAATNENRGFVDFLRGEPYRGRPAVRTASSAMDVALPSNLERIEWLYDGDVGRMANDIAATSVTDQATRACIRDVYENHGYVMDPHTAVAYSAQRALRGSGPSIVLATAHPAKFPDLVESAIGHTLPVPSDLADLFGREEHMTELNPTLGALASALDEVAA